MTHRRMDRGHSEHARRGRTVLRLRGLALIGLLLPAVVGFGQLVIGRSAVAGAAGGSSWTSQPVPNAANGLSAIACASTAVCEAVGSNNLGNGDTSLSSIVGTVNGGASWRNQFILPGNTLLTSISCPSTSTCVAVGVTGTVNGDLPIVLGTTDGGATWSSQSVPSNVAGLYGISCATTTDCAAVGSSNTYPSGGGLSYSVAVATNDGGFEWSSTILPSGSEVRSVSCALSTSCVAVGNNPNAAAVVETSTDSGISWTLQPTPRGLGQLLTVTCLTTSRCMATALVGNSSVPILTTDGGASWTHLGSFPGLFTAWG